MTITLQGSSPLIPTPSIASKIHRFKFHGTGEALFGIFILNLLKTILTLGVYYFWAKVKTRQFVWGQTEFSGDRFGYHGTGLELCLGWLKAGVLFGGVLALQWVLTISDHPYIGTLALWIGIGVLVPLAQIGTLRYRLSRSSWRGVRFSFRGAMQPFFLLSLRGLALSAITFGIFYPFYECESRAYLINQSRFGSSSFQFDGQPKDLFWIYTRHSIAMLVGMVILGAIIFATHDLTAVQDGLVAPLLGFAMFVPFMLLVGIVFLSVNVSRRRFFSNHTSFAGARFNTTVTMGNLLGLYATNALLLLFTLGLAFPWVTVRSRGYDCDHLTLTGALDLDAIQQDAQTATAVGEELSGFLDVDALPG
jgi:uncharacterized membrane protein YjgN (DUF898 family)